VTTPERNARRERPVQVVPEGEDLAECQHCGRRTWPIGRDAAGRRIDQCLYCLQRYDVSATETDEDHVDQPD
jgi:hypothetical protein